MPITMPVIRAVRKALWTRFPDWYAALSLASASRCTQATKSSPQIYLPGAAWQVTRLRFTSAAAGQEATFLSGHQAAKASMLKWLSQAGLPMKGIDSLLVGAENHPERRPGLGMWCLRQAARYR